MPGWDPSEPVPEDEATKAVDGGDEAEAKEEDEEPAAE